MKEAKLVQQARPAVFWKRVLAYCIDLFLINVIVVWPFKSYLEKYSNYALLLLQTGSSTLALITGIVVVLTLFYFISLDYKVKQTLGKMILHLHVSSTKGELGLGQAVLRNLTKPFPLLLGVDTLYMFFSRSNQRLFEKFSNTEVTEHTWTIH